MRVDLQLAETREFRDQLLSGYTFEDHTATRGIRGALDTLLSIDTEKEMTLWERFEFNQRWYELVKTYSEGRLTNPTDRLIALSGVAEKIAESSHGKYIAGMWSSVSLELGLLWRVVSSGKRQLFYCAPSWSWASVEGCVYLSASIQDNDHVNFHSEVQRAIVTFQGVYVKELLITLMMVI